MTNQVQNKMVDGNARRITAKFTGKCTKCAGVVPSGTQCMWSKAAGVSHIECPAPREADLSDAIRITQDAARAADQKKVTVTMGVFKKDGRIYVVKPNREKTRVYAKEIVESPARMTENGSVADFETRYAAGVVFKLTEADRWDLADAKDFLTKFSKCIVCGRHLKAAKSVAGAIGPICAKYFAHTHACDDKPVVKLNDVKAQAEMDVEDQNKRAAIAACVEIEDEGQQNEASELDRANFERQNKANMEMLDRDQAANAMMEMTPDQMALLAEIVRINKESDAWQKAAAGRISFLLTQDIAYWAECGIKSVADLHAMQDAEDAKERRKASYCYDDVVQPTVAQSNAQLLDYDHDRDHAIGVTDDELRRSGLGFI